MRLSAYETSPHYFLRVLEALGVKKPNRTSIYVNGHELTTIVEADDVEGWADVHAFDQNGRIMTTIGPDGVQRAAIMRLHGHVAFSWPGLTEERAKELRQHDAVESWWGQDIIPRIRWRIDVDDGVMMPEGYGLAWHRLDTGRRVCMIVPLNLIAGAVRATYHWIRRGFYASKMSPQFSDAIRFGELRGRAQGIQEAQAAFARRR